MAQPTFFADDYRAYQEWINKINNPSFWDKITGKDFTTKQMLLANPPAGAVRHMSRMSEAERRKANEITALASARLRANQSEIGSTPTSSPTPLPTFTASPAPVPTTGSVTLASASALPPPSRSLTQILPSSSGETRAHADFLMNNLNSNWDKATQPGGLLHFNSIR